MRQVHEEHLSISRVSSGGFRVAHPPHVYLRRFTSHIKCAYCFSLLDLVKGFMDHVQLSSEGDC